VQHRIQEYLIAQFKCKLRSNFREGVPLHSEARINKTPITVDVHGPQTKGDSRRSDTLSLEVDAQDICKHENQPMRAKEGQNEPVAIPECLARNMKCLEIGRIRFIRCVQSKHRILLWNVIQVDNLWKSAEISNFGGRSEKVISS
jgi:hypothetical protein